MQDRYNMRVVRLIAVSLIGFLWMGFAEAEAAAYRLPYPRALYHKVEFWKAVYTKYSTKEGVLHDSEDLSIVYEEVRLQRSGSNRKDRSTINSKRARIRRALFGILRKRGQNLTPYERKVLSKFPKYASRSRLLQATENIRFQRGQSDRFLRGIKASGRYMKDIERIIEEEGAPDFLKYLPHVESSFQEKAMSKVGAAGLWQLMPRTAAQFIKVNYAVDERLDPWKATRAAIKYLKQNLRVLGEWPLALTAYNHGAGGVRNAVRTLGTTDIAEIAFQYSTPRFGFASRNFYTQYLAAVQVAQDYKKYFGHITFDKPFEFEEIKIKRPTYFRAFSKKYRFDLNEFKSMNLGLRRAVYQNRRPIPRGTIIRLPKGAQRARIQVASLDKKIIKEAMEAAPQKAPRLEIVAPKSGDQKKVAARLKRPEKKKVEKALVQKQTKVKEPEVQEMPQEEVAIPELKENIGDSKYAVRDLAAGKAWIKIEINETITQVADWLDADVDEVREWNGMKPRSQVRMGQRLLVKLSEKEALSFAAKRRDYHNHIREEFFQTYKVDSFEDYEVQNGENLWSLCYQKFEIPPWLLEEFNPEVDILDIKPGTRLKIPVLVEQFASITETAANTNDSN